MGIINKHGIKYWLLQLTLIATVFDAYCFFYVGTFPITISFFLLTTLTCLNIVQSIKNSKIVTKDFLAVLLFIVIGITSFAFSPIENNITSLVLLIYFLITYLFSNDKMSEEELRSIFRVYWYVLIGVMLFGIYQFGAYMLDLPFQEIEILQKVEGFNTSNTVTIGSFRLKRIHSICLEPSVFSQYCALGVLLSFVYSRKSSEKWILSIMFGIAIVLSLSGTGIILLAGFMLIYFVKIKDKINTKMSLIAVAAVAMAVIVITNPEIILYLWNRLGEFSKGNSSSAIRFIQPYKVMFMIFEDNFFGIGSGNNTIAGNYLGLGDIKVTSGYAKAGIEYGVLGFMLLITLCCFIAQKYKHQDSFFIKGLVLYLFLLNIINDYFLMTSFWVVAVIMNSFKLSDENINCNGV